MNIKRIAALATLGALISTAGPAFAAGTPVTGTITVKWNTQTSAAITMFTQTTASKTSASPAANDIFYGSSPAASATSNCNGTQAASKDGASGGGWAALTVNFGNVTPDGANYTNCLETNAVEAYITTNDGNGFLLQAAISGVPATYATASNGQLICILPNGAWSTTGNTAWTASARAAAVAMNSTTACSTGTALTSTATPGVTLLNETGAVATAADLNADMQLNLGPNATTGATVATLTYTVTPN